MHVWQAFYQLSHFPSKRSHQKVAEFFVRIFITVHRQGQRLLLFEITGVSRSICGSSHISILQFLHDLTFHFGLPDYRLLCAIHWDCIYL